MIREPQIPRPDWREKMEQIGFGFHSIDGLYWQESYAYRFTEAQIDLLDDVTKELHQMCLDVAADLIRRGDLSRLAIDERWQPHIERSWLDKEPGLLGRMDLAYDGYAPPKLLEYNADTATSLMESSLAQWFWLKDVHPEADQFNSLHEKLVERWREIHDYWQRQHLAPTKDYPLHFLGIYTQEEDAVHLDYLLDTAVQAGLHCNWLNMDKVGWDGAYFVDHEGEAIRQAFKLYPWEWMLRDEFAPYLFNPHIRWIEPAWKMLLSNKGFLAYLWQAHTNHPNLLPTSFSLHDLPNATATGYARKPLFSREGAGVSLHYPNGQSESVPVQESPEGWIYQTLHPLPRFDNSWTLIGSWIVGDETAGIGIREDLSPITKDTSHFLPHYFK